LRVQGEGGERNDYDDNILGGREGDGCVDYFFRKECGTNNDAGAEGEWNYCQFSLWGWLLVHVWESRKIIGVDGGSWGECESDLESTRDKRKKEQFF